MATAPLLGGNLHEFNEIKYLQYVIFVCLLFDAPVDNISLNGLKAGKGFYYTAL